VLPALVDELLGGGGDASGTGSDVGAAVAVEDRRRI
jgi:hypothetical protein